MDSTKVQGNASINGMIDQATFEAQDHHESFFEESSATEKIAKYNGERLPCHIKSTYQPDVF